MRTKFFLFKSKDHAKSVLASITSHIYHHIYYDKQMKKACNNIFAIFLIE